MPLYLGINLVSFLLLFLVNHWCKFYWYAVVYFIIQICVFNFLNDKYQKYSFINNTYMFYKFVFHSNRRNKYITFLHYKYKMGLSWSSRLILIFDWILVLLWETNNFYSQNIWRTLWVYLYSFVDEVGVSDEEDLDKNILDLGDCKCKLFVFNDK